MIRVSTEAYGKIAAAALALDISVPAFIKSVVLARIKPLQPKPAPSMKAPRPGKMRPAEEGDELHSKEEQTESTEEDEYMEGIPEQYRNQR
jgi:hypothetical protein